MKPTLYLVDDERNVLNSLSRALKTPNYEVKVFEKPIEALNQLKQKKDDVFLIVSDHQMPEFTGLEFLKEAKSIQPHVSRYMISAFNDFNRVVESLNNGIIEKFFSKPWNIEELKNNVDLALENHSTKATHPNNPTLPDANPQHNYIDLAELIIENLQEEESLAMVILMTKNTRDIYLQYGFQKYQGLKTKVFKKLNTLIGNKYYHQYIDDATISILIPFNNKDPQKITPIIENIINECNGPYNINNSNCELQLIAGIASYPKHGVSAEFLLRNAQSAAFDCLHEETTIKHYQATR